MLTAVLLIGLAALTRVLSSTFQVWNFAPLGAISLFAGSRLPRRWAWLVPMIAMAISDFYLDSDRYRPVFELTRWTILGTYAATTLLGPLARHAKSRPWLLPVLSLSASTLFFITSNLSTWAEGNLFPLTASGLVHCYWDAIPFMRNTIAADLVGTALLFGLAPLFEQALARLRRPRLAEIRDEACSDRTANRV